MTKCLSFRWMAVLVALCGFLVVPLQAHGSPIQRIAINVLRIPDRDLIATLHPGDTLRLTVGQEVRLRMSAIPFNGSPHYPSTRFWVASGPARLQVKAANERTGNITIRALRVQNPRNAREATVIRYQILGKLDISPRLREGQIRVEVSEPRLERSSSTSEFSGIILYEQRGYRGRSAQFTTGQVRDLRNSAIGNATARSVRIEPGCQAVLYQRPDFEGRSTTITKDVFDLGQTSVGNDSVTSLTMDCRARDRSREMQRYGGRIEPRGSLGVTLFEHAGFAGVSETFDRDVEDLTNTRIGRDRASSVRVSPGCVAILFEDSDFRGRSIEVRTEISNLRNTALGDNEVSSLKLECGHRQEIPRRRRR